MAVAQTQSLLDFAQEGDPEPPMPPAAGRPYVSCGAARASYGDAGGSELDAGAPRSALVQYCPYSTRLCLLLAEGGVDFVLVKIDLTDVQGWYKAAFLPGDAPAMCGTPGGIEGEGWVGGSKECRERAAAAHPGVARANEVRSPVREEEVIRLGEALIFGGLAPRIAGTAAAKGAKVFAFMLKKTLGVEAATALLERTDTAAAMEEARSACRARLLSAIAEASTLLEAAEARGGFLGGDTPDPCDINLGGTVYTVKSLLESGLADVPNATGGLAALGAQSLERYLLRWVQRKSWLQVFGSAEPFNAVIVRSFANKLSTMAPDVCPAERVRAPCVRARHMDPRYQAMLQAMGGQTVLPTKPKRGMSRVEPAPTGDAAVRPAAQQSWQRAKLKVDAVTAISTAPQRKRPPTVAKQAQTIAKGSRVSFGLSGSYLYFLVLERPWWFCLTLSLGAYVVSILMSALLAATAVLSNTQEDLELELLNSSAPHWELCLRFAASHVITMGSGSVVPVSSWGYALSWTQMVLGLLVNVFVFSVVLAKFQAPQSDLVWTEGCVIAPRDGVPTLLLRVGNLRCHTLYSPAIRLTLLRRHVTREGESFFRRHELEVDQPATMSGVHTVAHAIDEASPLKALYDSGMLRRAMGADESNLDGEGGADTRRLSRLSIHAVVQAFDNVYGGDLSATRSYAKASVRFSAVFEDMISMTNGHMQISWEHFNTTVPLEVVEQRKAQGKEKRRQALQQGRQVSSREGGSSGMDGRGKDGSESVLDFAQEGDPEPPMPPAAGRPYVSCGAARASYGDAGGSELDAGAPRSALVQYCPYSTRLCLLLAEGGVDFVLVKIDLTDVQGWYKAAFLPGDAPAMCGTPGGIEGEGWVGGSKECRERAAAAHPGVARANEVRSPVREEEVIRLGEALIFGGLAPRIAGTAAAKGAKVFAFMLKKTLGVEAATALLERTDTAAAMEEARSACRARLLSAIAEASTLLEAAEARGGFLGGDTPDPCDINLGGTVYTVKSLLESGLADVPNATGGLAALGAQSLERYLLRWVQRKSWLQVFGSAEPFNAVIVRSFANKLSTMAPDVCPAERVRAPCVRARHMDPRYQAMLQAMGALVSPKTKANRALSKLMRGQPEKEAPEEEEEELDDDSQDAAICT